MERTEGLDEATHNAIESAAARARLPEKHLAVLEAIVRGGPRPKDALAWVKWSALVDEEFAPDDMDRLVEMGLIAEWMLGGELHYTLAPYGAWLMQVHILERLSIRGEEIEEDPYWAELDREPAPLHLPKRRHEIRWPWMEELPDPKTIRRHGEVMRDEDGEEVRVMGRVVPIDPKLKGAKGKKSAKQPKRRKAG